MLMFLKQKISPVNAGLFSQGESNLKLMLRTNYCDICKKLFHRKGIARHRKAHVQREMGTIKGPMPKPRRDDENGNNEGEKDWRD